MIVIKNAKALQFEPSRVWKNVDLVIEGDRILAVGEKAGQNIEADKVIDASGKLVHPGLVCSHHHYYSGLSRGIMANVGPTPDFVSVLRNLWWKLDRALDEEALYYSSMINSIEAIKAGTTTVVDHHASPNYIRGSLETVKRGFIETGLRGMTCYEVTDRNGREGMLEGIEENLKFAEAAEKEKQAAKGGGKPHLVEASIGGHAPFTLPDEGLEGMAEVVKKTGRGLHLHVAEGRYDVSDSHLNHGQDIMTRLARFDLLDEKSIFVHGVFLSEADLAMVNEADSFLIHNARSNMNNGVGYNSRLPRYRNVALGTDGIGANMYEEFKFAYFKHKDDGGPLFPDTYQRYLSNGDRLLERYFDGNFGRLEKGCMADLVISDYLPPTPLEGENIAGHLAFGMTSTDVRTVIINGKIVYEDRVFPFDDQKVFEESRKAALKVWEKINALDE